MLRPSAKFAGGRFFGARRYRRARSAEYVALAPARGTKRHGVMNDQPASASSGRTADRGSGGEEPAVEFAR